MPATCKICGAQNPVNSHYCGICGAALTTEKFTVIPQSKIDTAKADLTQARRDLTAARDLSDSYRRLYNSAQATISSLRHEINMLKQKRTVWQKLKKWWIDNEIGTILLGIAITGAICAGLWYVYEYFFTGKPEQKEGLEIVTDSKSGLMGVYNHDIDSMIVADIYADISVMTNEPSTWFLLKAKHSGKYSIASASGQEFASTLDTAYFLPQSWLIITERGGKKDLYASNGFKILPRSYDYVLDNPNGWYGNIIPARNATDNGWTLFNRKTGKLVSGHRFNLGNAKSMNAFAVQSRYANTFGIIDVNGVFVVPSVMKEILGGSDNIFLCIPSDKKQPAVYYKEDGTVVATMPANNTLCGTFQNGLAPVWRGEYLCYIDTLGNQATGYNYKQIKDGAGNTIDDSPWFRDGKARVIYNDAVGTLDKSFTFTPD